MTASFETIQQELHDFRCEVTEWRDALRDDVDSNKERIAVIESTYSTRDDIESTIESSISIPLRDINDTFNKINITLQAIQKDLEPWKRRQRVWSLTQVLGRDAGSFFSWVGKIGAGVLMFYGFGAFMGWW